MIQLHFYQEPSCFKKLTFFKQSSQNEINLGPGVDLNAAILQQVSDKFLWFFFQTAEANLLPLYLFVFKIKLNCSTNQSDRWLDNEGPNVPIDEGCCHLSLTVPACMKCKEPIRRCTTTSPIRWFKLKALDDITVVKTLADIGGSLMRATQNSCN